MVPRLPRPYFRSRRAKKPSATTPKASSGRVLEASGTEGGSEANAAAVVARAARRRRVLIGGKSSLGEDAIGGPTA